MALPFKTIGNFGVANLRKSADQVKRSVILFCFLVPMVLLLCIRCANQVTPQGGPKDTAPPRVLACDPPNFSTHINTGSFRIDFDEFVNLKNPSAEIFISPPMKNPPDTKMRGKSLLVKLEDKIDTGITYSVSFGNSITDLTEGNVLKGFSYVFSTGNRVDSMSLQGTLLEAFNHKPVKNAFVELYIDNNDTIPFDSLPLHVPPYYISKTDENGQFVFHNLRSTKFKLFALADQNSDMVFNQVSEKIAFIDSLVTPFYMPPARSDTSRHDTLSSGNDSTRQDTTTVKKADSLSRTDTVKTLVRVYPSIPMFLFEEIDSVQRIVKSSFIKEGTALLSFRFPVRDLRIVPLNFDSAAPWYLPEFSENRDSVTLWITRPVTDTLVLKVTDHQKIIDTVTIEPDRKLSRKKSQDKPVLIISNTSRTSSLNQLRNKLTLGFNWPVARWDFSKILLVDGNDTVHPPIAFTDSLRRKMVIDHKWTEDRSYQVIIPDSVFFGINDLSHDTVRISFKTVAERDFGNFVLTIGSVRQPGQYIIQLLNENESARFEEKIISRPCKVHFDFLPPMKYRVKIIHDRNGNGRWDTGNYRTKLQPEEVIYLPKLIEVRANWDIEESLD